MTLARSVHVVEGYDCRVDRHKPKAAGRDGHGIHCDEWVYTLVDPAVGALALHVYTPFFPRSVDPPPFTSYRGAFIGMCTPHVTSRQLVASATPPSPCAYLGQCYDWGTWSLLAGEIFEETFEARLQPRIEDPQPRLWAKLEEFFAEQANAIKVARHEHGDLGWRRCEHCNGEGVLPRAAK